MNDRANDSQPNPPVSPDQTTDHGAAADPVEKPAPALIPDQTTDHGAGDPNRTTDLPSGRPAGDTGRRPDTSVGPRDPVGRTATYHPEANRPDRTGAYIDSDAPESAPRKPGEPTVPGFEILGELGRGGMGVVYKAHHFALDRVVALKMILAGANASPAQIERFFVEARAVAKFQRPDIVQIFEVGEVGGLPYCALEFVAGGALSAKLAREPQPPKYAAEVTLQLARAMEYAHKQGLIHRDLKPANILVGADGQLKVTDFGLAKELAADSGQTQSGQIVGTPSWRRHARLGQAFGDTAHVTVSMPIALPLAP